SVSSPPPMVITLDGPAGSGKSTLARRLAARLGFEYLDSGAYYRAAAWLVRDRGIDPGNAQAVARAIEGATLHVRSGPDGPRIEVDGRDVSRLIRSPDVEAIVSRVAAIREVRQAVVRRIREDAGPRDLVADGRDMGTVVFPDAGAKFFVTATVEERARRRTSELAERGFSRPYPAVMEEMSRRDRQDETRDIAPLRKADGAIEIDTTGRTVEDLLDFIEASVRPMPRGV
ncbi:MAG: (d)CMP kinase, partial [Planctomycetes bacterium]|nr:(d)CMP kinase [Planctomycetota bacterium]